MEVERESEKSRGLCVREMPTDVNFKTIEHNLSRGTPTMGRSERSS